MKCLFCRKNPNGKNERTRGTIIIDFHNEVPDVAVIQWNGKLLPPLHTQEVKVERLTIVTSYENKEKLDKDG